MQNQTVKKPTAKSHYTKSDLEKMRQNYGFDNIPVDDEDMSNIRLRDIFKAWAMQITGHKENPSKPGYRDRLHTIKNDLKWALQADLDKPVAPHTPAPKPEKKPTAATTSTPSSQSSSQQIEININFDSLPSITNHLKFLIDKFKLTRKKIIITSATVGVIIIGGYFAIDYIDRSSHIADSQESLEPTYNTVIPNGKTIDKLGGWKKVSPPGVDPVFAYTDSIDNVQINVSQQPVPDGLKANQNERIKGVAEDFGATEKIETPRGTTFYLGQSAKGIQSVIFTRNDLLILIKTHDTINTEEITGYVDSLITPVPHY